MRAYEAAAAKFAEIHKLQAVATQLFWDSKTMMPVSASAGRGEQMGALTQVVHEKSTSPDLTGLIADAEQEHNELDDWQRANVREMKRLNVHAQAVAGDTAVAFAKAKNDAGVAWVNAKANNDFKSFQPHLEQVFGLQIEIAQAKAETLGLGVYDALLDEHDPGSSTAEIDRLFGELEAFLPAFVQQVSQRQSDPIPLDAVAADLQDVFIRTVIQRMGWPEDGRLDHTEHPFAMAGSPGDPRITTYYDPHNVVFTMMAAFHECGHGMYELNLPKNKYAYQPVGVHRGGSTHESQLLGVEMMACRSQEFLSWLFPRLRQAFNVSGDAWTDENLMAHYRRVKPSFILSEGCLQDVHWSMGFIGYFPTYLLGALKAAQFFDAAKRARAELLPSLAEGEFAPWMDWLRDNVHQHASFYSAGELLERATGSPLQATALIGHFQERYRPDPVS